MIKLLITLLFFSCAGVRKSSLPPEAEVKVRKYSSAQEARNSVRNRFNYLLMLFEQSHDPYYGTPKWPEECLKKHDFGKIQETSGNLFFSSRLLLDSSGEPGNCQGKPTDVIYLHCQGEMNMREIHCPPDSCKGYLQGQPCS